MDTERVIRNQVNVDALTDTLETRAKCLVSVFLSILSNNFLYHFIAKYCTYYKMCFWKDCFKALFYLFDLIYKNKGQRDA